MKTKNLLVIILLIGLSFNAFSQEQVTIKQVIKNTSTNPMFNGDDIGIIKIWTDLPVTIKSGKENAIYLTGDMKDNEKDKISSFCLLRNKVFDISSPYLYLDEEFKAKDFSKFKITLELADNVYAYFLEDKTNVTLKKEITSDQHALFILGEKSQMTVEGETKLGVLNINAQENSKIRFNNIEAQEAVITMKNGSVVDLNGKIKRIDIMEEGEGSKLIGDYKCSSMERHNVDYKKASHKSMNYRTPRIDKSGNVISSKGDTIEKAGKEDSSLVLKNLSETFGEVANDLNEEEPNEVFAPIAKAFKEVADNLEKEDEKEIGHKGKKKASKTDFTLQLGYGISGFSPRLNSIDNLFASPKGQYSLQYSNSWTLGFRYEIKLNNRWQLSTGLGYESNIFRFDNNVMLSNIGGEKRIDFETDPTIDAESKLVARYITLPLFVKFRVIKDLNVHLGAIAGVNFRTSSTGFKRKYDIPNGEIIERSGAKYDNFKPIKLDVQAGIGWDDINLYVKYALTPLFKNNKEIEVYPYSIGISFGI